MLFTLTGTAYHRDDSSSTCHLSPSKSPMRAAASARPSPWTLTAALAGHLYLDSPAKRVVLILAVLPITILKNAIRIATLTLLQHSRRSVVPLGQLHHDGGIVFFVLGLAMMVPVLTVLKSPWRRAHLRTTAPLVAVS